MGKEGIGATGGPSGLTLELFKTVLDFDQP